MFSIKLAISLIARHWRPSKMRQFYQPAYLPLISCIYSILCKQSRRRVSMKFICDLCGWVYDEEEGYPEGGIAPGTPFSALPDDFECPLCFIGKDQFSPVE